MAVIRRRGRQDLGIFCEGDGEKPRRISVRIPVSSSLVKDVAMLWLNLGGLEREVSGLFEIRLRSTITVWY